MPNFEAQGELNRSQRDQHEKINIIDMPMPASYPRLFLLITGNGDQVSHNASTYCRPSAKLSPLSDLPFRNEAEKALADGRQYVLALCNTWSPIF